MSAEEGTSWTVTWSGKGALSIRVVERMLLYHAQGEDPIRRLAVAVICQALIDSRLGDGRTKRCGRNFILSDRLDPWAWMIHVRPEFIRELARLARYCL